MAGSTATRGAARLVGPGQPQEPRPPSRGRGASSIRHGRRRPGPPAGARSRTTPRATPKVSRWRGRDERENGTWDRGATWRRDGRATVANPYAPARRPDQRCEGIRSPRASPGTEETHPRPGRDQPARGRTTGNRVTVSRRANSPPPTGRRATHRRPGGRRARRRTRRPPSDPDQDGRRVRRRTAPARGERRTGARGQRKTAGASRTAYASRDRVGDAPHDNAGAGPSGRLAAAGPHGATGERRRAEEPQERRPPTKPPAARR